MKLLSMIFSAAILVRAFESTPFNPASVPLAVRSPYLSAWLAQGQGTALNDDWPTFWTGSILGWAGFASVDGVAYSFLGAPLTPGVSFAKAVQTNFSFTATKSIFHLTAGPVDLEVQFFSPVEPDSFLLQSIPFSYLTVTARPNDGRTHSVQVYTDISAEWVSGDNNLKATWSTTTEKVVTHEVQLEKQAPFEEVNDHIQHGSAFYSIKNSNSVTYQTGADVAVRTEFIKSGRLANARDTQFRAINDRWPVLALSKDLGAVQASGSASALFTVGHVRDPAIRHDIGGGTVRSGYFWSKYPTPAAMISDFINDYEFAVQKAAKFDAKVFKDATKISKDYAGIVSLSIRQAFAATEITVLKHPNGTYDASNVLIFMKEISSNGNMNTIDVIFPAWPLFLYTNPTYGRRLLEPTLQYVSSGQYPNKYCVHDLGEHYPRATGHNDGNDEKMPVEESGNVLIMALSYVRKTNDIEFIKRYYNFFDQYTQFLITDALIPENQLSTDDFAGHLANQTNLAVKGIIGIKAMSEIARIMGYSEIALKYSDIAGSYVESWEKLAMSSNGKHLTLNYNNPDSWGLTYNLYGDKLLNLDLFPKRIYELQNDWYKTVARPFGVPLDTRHTYTKSDWEIWMAAIATDLETRDLFIGAVKKSVSSGVSRFAFGDWYETTDGTSLHFRARPVVGGHLALLVLPPQSVL